MSDNLDQSQLLAGLPFDVLLNIFSDCYVEDVLSLSATSKRLNQASGDHQTWLDQVTRLQIPIPIGVVPSTAELKNWAISWVRSDEPWVKPRGEDGHSLDLHWFDTWQKSPDEPAFVMANFIPGGKFVVFLYADGQIDLKEIKIESEDKWNLQDVAQYEQDDPEGYSLYWGQLLTETRFGRPLVAYADRDRESLQVFLIDHIAGIIERKQVVKLDEDDCQYGVYSIHARGNTILWSHEIGIDCWGITVSELSLNPAQEFFTLSINRNPEPGEIRFFMVSENSVVICDTEGILLYQIPELSSTIPRDLSPVWEWSGESKWFCGSVCTVSPHHPVLYLQGTSGTHTITFRTDACGRGPVVVKHHVIRKLPAHLTSLEGDDHLFTMKGRKVLHYMGEVALHSEFSTCLVGREELTGRFRADLDVNKGKIQWDDHEVKFADFDERTGRILIGTNERGPDGEGQGTRIYLADLPP